MKRSTFFKALLALPFVPGVLAKLKPAPQNVLVAFRQETDFATVPTAGESTILRQTIRYGLCPGWVPVRVIGSRTTPDIFSDWGGMNYVSAPELARLYRVRMEECVVFKTVPEARFALRWGPYEGNERGLIMLRPRADGDYTLDAFALRFAARDGRRTI
ncbi:MAG TPA: hypothetical protein VNA25_02070 [Phycisphaerae bacterium]|nr:hypothetical protein [Phycisphaerae bacterium]